MDTNKFKKQLKEIKATNFSEWSVSFWLVKRKISQKNAHYDVLRVKTDKKLQKRFHGYIRQQLQHKDFHLTPYDFNNADGDDSLFTIDTAVTDFVKVAEKSRMVSKAHLLKVMMNSSTPGPIFHFSKKEINGYSPGEKLILIYNLRKSDRKMPFSSKIIDSLILKIRRFFL